MRAAGFTVDDLIACYQRGVFPMADARDDERIFLIDPDRCGVIPLQPAASVFVGNVLAQRVDQASDIREKRFSLHSEGA